jgi:hypothetical protein
VQDPTAIAAQAQAAEQARLRQQAAGRASTILTSPTGLTASQTLG